MDKVPAAPTQMEQADCQSFESDEPIPVMAAESPVPIATEDHHQ
jgi:hypothetical protein